MWLRYINQVITGSVAIVNFSVGLLTSIASVIRYVVITGSVAIVNFSVGS